MKRRTFLQGTATIAAIISAPSIVLANPNSWHEVETSFFARQNYFDSLTRWHKKYNPTARNMTVYSLRYYTTKFQEYILDKEVLSPLNDPVTTDILEDNPSNRLNISIFKEDVGPDYTPQFEVESLGHAEHRFLHVTHPSRDVYNHLVHGPDIEYKYGFRLINMIIRGCNRIGFMTRRGAGNQIIYHPDNQVLIETAMKPIMIPSYNITYFPTYNCPIDKIVCRYNGQYGSHIDTAQIFANTGQGTYLWEMNSNETENTNFFGNGVDYTQEIKLLNI